MKRYEIKRRHIAIFIMVIEWQSEKDLQGTDRRLLHGTVVPR